MLHVIFICILHIATNLTILHILQIQIYIYSVNTQDYTESVTVFL